MDDDVREGVVQRVQLLIAEGGKVADAFAGSSGLHPTDVDALLHVVVAQDRGAPMTPGGLGEALDLSSGAVTSVVDRLERGGHVERVRDDHDRRRIHLHLSPRGRAVGHRFFEALQQRTDSVMDDFTDAELVVVDRFLAGTTDAMAAHRAGLAPPARSA